jgi:hypothetical protein
LATAAFFPLLAAGTFFSFGGLTASRKPGSTTGAIGASSPAEGVMEGATGFAPAPALVLAVIGGGGDVAPNGLFTLTMVEEIAVGRDAPKMKGPGKGAPIMPASTSALLASEPTHAPVEVVGVWRGYRWG